MLDCLGQRDADDMLLHNSLDNPLPLPFLGVRMILVLPIFYFSIPDAYSSAWHRVG